MEQLTRLCCLEIWDSFLAGADYWPLAQLTPRTLKLHNSCNLPDCLRLCTALHHLQAMHTPLLHWDDSDSDSLRTVQLEAALAPLTQLSHLAIRGAAPPSTLTKLSCLQNLAVWGREPSRGLPAGPWLARLRAVELTLKAAADSIPSLAAATQLESLKVSEFTHKAGPYTPHMLALLSWAASRPSLRHLAFPRPSSVPLDPLVVAAADQARLQNPCLSIDLDA